MIHSSASRDNTTRPLRQGVTSFIIGPDRAGPDMQAQTQAFSTLTKSLSPCGPGFLSKPPIQTPSPHSYRPDPALFYLGHHCEQVLLVVDLILGDEGRQLRPRNNFMILQIFRVTRRVCEKSPKT
jgi:hypothetical protein